MDWIRPFCIYQLFRALVLITSLPMLILGAGLSSLLLRYPHLDSGGIVLAIMSTFLTIIGLSGNLSSIKKSKYATLAYGITLLLVCGVEVSVGCIIYFKYESLSLFIREDLIASQRDVQYQKPWTDFKEQFDCCLNDYKNNCSMTCIDQLRRLFYSKLFQIGNILIALFFFQLISACLSLCLYGYYLPSEVYKSEIQNASKRPESSS